MYVLAFQIRYKNIDLDQGQRS